MRCTTKMHGCLDEKFHDDLRPTYGRTDGRTDGKLNGQVITKISRIYTLPFFLTHGTPLCASRERELS